MAPAAILAVGLLAAAPLAPPPALEESPDMIMLTGEQAEAVAKLIRQQRDAIETLVKKVERLQNGGGCT
jgi:hypothetical protein